MMNKQMCVDSGKRMLENGCSTSVWTPEFTISLNMFVIHVLVGNVGNVSEEFDLKIKK